MCKDDDNYSKIDILFVTGMSRTKYQFYQYYDLVHSQRGDMGECPPVRAGIFLLAVGHIQLRFASPPGIPRPEFLAMRLITIVVINERGALRKHRM
jgi:hypothetical protein